MAYFMNKNYIFGALALGFALVFIVGFAGASPAQACSYGGCDYYPPVYYPPTQTHTSPLQVECYPQPLTANVGDSITWVSSVYGASGAYSYSWSGTDGLVGAGPSISKAYYTSGSKSATLTVTSDGQTKSVSCSGAVTVYGNNNNYYPPVYPPYNPPPTTYYPLQVSCTPNVTYTNVGNAVTWSASVYGGSYNNYYGNYSYSWSGSDGIYGYGQSITSTYNTPGYKTATVTVTGNGQTVTQTCSNSVNVSGYNYGYGYGYQNSYYTNTYTNTNTLINTNNNGLNIGCYSDPNNASINQPITWTVEVTGGVGPYTYSWSGTDGISGSSETLIKYYSTSGEKNAVVSVSSADGKTGTRACSNTVNVRRPAGSTTVTAPVKTTPTTSTETKTTTDTNQSAAALFSLEHVPWGWIALLIILVLFATVLYLIFNRPKI